MAKDYKNNKRLKEYVEYNIGKMGINDRFSPLLVDVMLRRFSEFDFSMQEVYQDMVSLVNNLNQIKIGPMPDDMKSAAGIYSFDTRDITISEEYIKNAKTPQDFEKIYEIFTHEVFHALARDEHGTAKISTQNRYTKMAYYSLEEAIVEKAADRCVYGRRWDEKNSPFFHQNEFGYSDITYITDVIEATYGVSEKAFLRHAIQGRKNVEVFLSAISGEKEEDTLDYLDRVELNYSTLHKALYSQNLSNEQAANVIKDTMTAGLLISSWKMNENIGRLDGDAQDFQIRVGDFKYGHNKLYLVSKHAAEHFDSRFSNQNIFSHVFGVIKNTRDDNSYRINTLSELLKKQADIPQEDMRILIEAAKRGKRELEGENLFEKYEISQESPEFIPLESDSYLGFRRSDFESTEWDNAEISEDVKVFKDIYEEMNKSDFASNLRKGFDKLKQVFKKAIHFFGGNTDVQNLLGPGENTDSATNSDSNFGKLSPEDMQKFTEGMQQVLTAYKANEMSENKKAERQNDEPDILE